MLASYFQQTRYTGENQVNDLINGEVYNSVMTFDFNSGKVQISLDDSDPVKVITYDKWDNYRKDWVIL